MATLLDRLTKGPSIIRLEDYLKDQAKKKAKEDAKKAAKGITPATDPIASTSPNGIQIKNVIGPDGKTYQVLVQNGVAIPYVDPTLYAQSNPAVQPATAPVATQSGPLDLFAGLDPKILLAGGAGLLAVMFLSKKKGRR